MLNKSRLNRRQHRIADLFLTVFNLLDTLWKHLNDKSIYILDSFPMAACDKNRNPRSRRYICEDWCGLLLKHIHTVTARGFELKVALFVLAVSFNSF